MSLREPPQSGRVSTSMAKARFNNRADVRNASTGPRMGWTNP
jgi:hypothetical protein